MSEDPEQGVLNSELLVFVVLPLAGALIVLGLLAWAAWEIWKHL